MSPSTERHERSLAVSRVLGDAIVEARRLPFPAAKRRLERAELEALTIPASDHERKEVRRRAAETLLMVACSHADSWTEVNSCYDNVVALGFTDAGRHVQDAALLARWCIDHRGHQDRASRELAAAKTHVSKLRKDPRLRERLLVQIADMQRLLESRPERPGRE